MNTKDVANNLRKSHFILGNDGILYLIWDKIVTSQYKNDYINRPVKLDNHDYTNINKLTNLKLGNLK